MTMIPYDGIEDYGSDVDAFFEIGVIVSGWRYLVIYGNHINGGFCAIPNFAVSCEMADPENVGYNKEKLAGIKGIDSDDAYAIARAIRDYYLYVYEKKHDCE